MKFDISMPGGYRVTQYAFFDMSCYKFSLKQEPRHRDLARVCPVFSGHQLRAHVTHVTSSHAPVNYVCTALWNPHFWSRDPDGPSQHVNLDTRFMEKYERIVSTIVSSSSSTNTSSAPSSLSAVQSSSSVMAVLPSPIPASSTSIVTR